MSATITPYSTDFVVGTDQKVYLGFKSDLTFRANDMVRIINENGGRVESVRDSYPYGAVVALMPSTEGSSEGMTAEQFNQLLKTNMPHNVLVEVFLDQDDMLQMIRERTDEIPGETREIIGNIGTEPTNAQSKIVVPTNLNELNERYKANGHCPNCDADNWKDGPVLGEKMASGSGTNVSAEGETNPSNNESTKLCQTCLHEFVVDGNNQIVGRELRSEVGRQTIYMI
jgi:hypothetical protein